MGERRGETKEEEEIIGISRESRFYQYLSLSFSDLNLIVGCEKGSVALLERYIGEGLRRYAVSVAKRSKFFFINWVSAFPTLLAYFFHLER